MIQYGHSTIRPLKRVAGSPRLERGKIFCTKIAVKFPGVYKIDPECYTDRDTLLPVTVVATGETLLITPANLLSRKKQGVRPKFWVNVNASGSITVGKRRGQYKYFPFYSKATAEKIKKDARSCLPTNAPLEIVVQFVELLHRAWA